ncbi:methyltransferase domain-containing protein [Nakamurella lactea]|uniref:methyltransferase domain-containing protein n=1 Tax=Nakamurella lactea TaxID=459515 RepID=UPI001377E1A7|nr:methyltransferase domain-containing protein [Nakamurella lactea]
MALVDYLDRATRGLAELQQMALNALGVRPGQRILDLGCGAGHFLETLTVLGAQPVGVDVSSVMTTQARQRCGPRTPVVRGTASGLPFKDAAFDGCHTERVLQHLSDLPAAVAELARLTIGGGRFASLETHWNSFRLTVGDPAFAGLVAESVPAGFRQPDLRSNLPPALEAAGFTSVRMRVDTMRSTLADLTAVNIPKALARIASTGAVDKRRLDSWWTDTQQQDAPDAVLLDRIVFSADRN